MESGNVTSFFTLLGGTRGNLQAGSLYFPFERMEVSLCLRHYTLNARPTNQKSPSAQRAAEAASRMNR